MSLGIGKHDIAFFYVQRVKLKGEKWIYPLFPLLLLLQLKIFLQNLEPYVMPLVIGMNVIIIQYIS